MKKIALLLALVMLLGMLPLTAFAEGPEDSWDLFQADTLDYTQSWKIAQGNKTATTYTQKEGFVNLAKADGASIEDVPGGPYLWLTPKAGIDLPDSQSFTAEATVRLAAPSEGGLPGEISARLGKNSNDTNGKLYRVYLKYGADGWISVNSDGTDGVSVDTTAWHNYGMVVDPVNGAFDVYVDGALKIQGAAPVTYKGADLFRIGIDSRARSNIDVKSARIGSGNLSALLSAAEKPAEPDPTEPTVSEPTEPVVSDPTEPADDKILFQDDFSQDSGAWTTSGGTWTVADGVYNQGAVGAAMTFAGDPLWENYEVEVSVTPISTSKNIAVMLSGRADGANNRYIGAYNNGVLSIEKRVGGNAKTLASMSYRMELNTTYDFRLVFLDETITFYVNGTKMLEAADTSHTHGTIGLATYNTVAKFDDLAVRKLDGVPVVADKLTTIALQDYQVVQRNPETGSADMTISGIAGGADKVEARVMAFGEEDAPVVDWTALPVDGSANTYSGTVTVPQGGWYRLEIRAMNADGTLRDTIIGENRWGVGMNILCIGQSNMVGQGKKPYTEANDLVANCYYGTWKHLEDPYAGAGASIVPAMGNALVEELGIPIGIIPAAVSGTGLHVPNKTHPAEQYWMYYNETNPADVSTLYGKALSRAKGAGGIELIVWNQGETDGAMEVSREDYEADVKTLLQRFRKDLNDDSIPFFLCQIGTHDTNISADAAYSEIRYALQNLDDGENIFMAATEMEFERQDTAHYTTPGLNEIGKRVANGILYYYGQSEYYRGPYIASADYADSSRSVVDVTIAHRGGTDISTTGEITGFTAYSGKKEVEVTSAVRLNATTIRLTLAEAIPEHGSLRYLYGLNPAHTNVAKDNTPLQLPLEITTADLMIGDDTPAPDEETVWDILDHDFYPQWNSEGFRSSSKVGSITQKEDCVNILKPDGDNLGSARLYHWVISPAGVSLPRTGFTLKTTVRAAGDVPAASNEIGIRMGEHSEDYNGKIASVFLGYGKEGYISTSSTGQGPNTMTLDTTVWHTLSIVVYPTDNGYSYDLYVDDELAFDNVALQTYKGGDLVRFGADNDARCNLDVKDVRLGSGMILPDGVSPAKLKSVTLSADGQKETESKVVTVTVTGTEFTDGEPVTVTLLDKAYNAVAGVTASSIFTDNTAVMELTIPEGLDPSVYYVKAEANRRKAYSGTYTVQADREAPVFPSFEPKGFTIEMEDYKYNPTQEFNFPSILDTKDHPVSNELGDYRYYLFYAPHDAPAGCCVAASNSLDGPWVEYGNNPVVSKTWAKEDGSGNYYSVSHVSSPYVMWNDIYNCWFMYFHGENPTTRYATSDDLIHWNYGGVCVNANDFSPTGSGLNEASYARVFEHEVPGLGNKYIMLLMVTGSGTGGHRNIYWAHSKDGKTWTAVTTSLLDPTMDSTYKGNFSGPYFMEWDGRYYVICHASSGNMYAFEVGESLNMCIPWGVFYNSKDSVNSDAEDESAYPDYGRSGAPSFMLDDDGVWHMYYEGGRRLHANIVHATSHVHAYGDWVVTEEATCTEVGQRERTCSCGDRQVEVIPATGHSYGEPVFTWSEDGKSCTAVVTCEHDDTHVLTADGEVTAEVTREATCSNNGVTTYTAKVELNGKTYTDVKEVADIPALGHTEVLEGKKEATCTEEGYTGDRVCSVCGEVLEKGKAIPKSAHTYQNGKCTHCGVADPDYKATETKPGDRPNTGDSSHVILWITLLGFSTAILAGFMISGKRKKAG